MYRGLVWRAVLLAFLAAMAGTAAAAEGYFHAVVVGVSNYDPENPGIRDASNGIADRLARFAGALGYDAAHVDIVRVLDETEAGAPDAATAGCEVKFGQLLGKRCRPRSEHILSLLERARLKSPNVDSTFVFYFHGHGATENGELILKASGWPGEGSDFDISMRKVEAKIRALSAGTKIVILDACRYEDSGVQGVAPESYPHEAFSGPAPPSGDPVFIYSTGESKYSYLERIKNPDQTLSWAGGYFSVALAAYLDEILAVDDATRADLTFAHLANRVTQLIQKEAQDHSDLRPREQRPSIQRDQDAPTRRLFPRLAAAPVATIYTHPAGRLEKVGKKWFEYSSKPDSPPNFSFEEVGVEDGYIYIVDPSRVRNGNDPGRPLYVRVPVNGGTAQWSYPNPFVWAPLYMVGEPHTAVATPLTPKATPAPFAKEPSAASVSTQAAGFPDVLGSWASEGYVGTARAFYADKYQLDAQEGGHFTGTFQLSSISGTPALGTLKGTVTTCGALSFDITGRQVGRTPEKFTMHWSGQLNDDRNAASGCAKYSPERGVGDECLVGTLFRAVAQK